MMVVVVFTSDSGGVGGSDGDCDDDNDLII